MKWGNDHWGDWNITHGKCNCSSILSSGSHSQSLIYFRVSGIYLFRFPCIIFLGVSGVGRRGPDGIPQELSSLSPQKRPVLKLSRSPVAQLHPAGGVICDELLLCEPHFSLCKMGLRIIFTLWGSGEDSPGSLSLVRSTCSFKVGTLGKSQETGGS